MGIVKMKRLTLVGPLSTKPAVLNTLSKLGAVDIRDNAEKAEVWQAKVGRENAHYRKMLEDKQLLDSVIPIADKLAAQKKPMFAAKRSVSIQQFMRYDSGELRTKVLSAARELQGNRQKYEEALAEKAQASLQRDILLPWQEALGDSEVDDTRRIRTWLGHVSNMIQYENLVKALAEVNHTAVVKVLLNKDVKSVAYLVLAAPAVDGELAFVQAQQYGFQPLRQKAAKLSPQEELGHCERKLRELDEELAILQEEGRRLSSEKACFEELSDYFAVQIEKVKADEHILSSERLFVIQGYIPEHLAKGTKKGLEETYCVSVMLEDVTKSDEYPILLSNGKFSSPYEAVIDMFSLPNASEVDPTPTVAPFYCIFFGMMFSDVAYGIIFCLITALLVYKFKVQGGLRKMCQMFFQCGLSSIVWGVLFGGFFGNLIDAFSGASVKFPALWFNPMDDPMKMMIWSVIFGVLHIFVGMGVKVKILAATGKLKEALLDVVPWYLIIGGLGVFAYGVAGGAPVLKTVGLYVLIVGAAVVLLFAGRSTRNPILRILKGVGALYDITSYFSDIMSYTRILALCLSTSVIAMVVNLLALLPGKNVLGLIFFVVIAVLGHTLNFALSALSAYVHTTRLHYVEFFGKFYEGGGRAFDPLAYRTKYVQIDRAEAEPKPIKESLKHRFARFITAG